MVQCKKADQLSSFTKGNVVHRLPVGKICAISVLATKVVSCGPSILPVAPGELKPGPSYQDRDYWLPVSARVSSQADMRQTARQNTDSSGDISVVEI